jgi:hypothetical protein
VAVPPAGVVVVVPGVMASDVLPPLAVLVAVAVDVGEPEPEGENRDDVEGEPDVQPEMAAHANMARMPQPTAGSLTRSAVLVIAVRTFIQPPQVLSGGDPFSPVPGLRNRHRKKKPRPARSLPASAEDRSPKASATITARLTDGADMQWRAHHRNIRLRE